MLNVNAEIITIGDEILIGQVIDTNSAWLAKQLNSIGINVYQITSVSDDKTHIIKSLDLAYSRADLILVTGGLGPTKDDITKQTIAEYFRSNIVRNEKVYEHVKQILQDRNVGMNVLNERQSDIPDNCIVLQNDFGTAPGMWFEKDKKIFVFLPGVPYEMEGIVKNELIPGLISHFQTPAIYHKTLMLVGIAESNLALLIEPWESQLPAGVKLAYLPSHGVLRLRLTAKGDSLENLKILVGKEVNKVMPLIKPYYYSGEDEPIEVTINKLLKDSNKTISIAESCTGGLIAGLITSVPGSSGYFKGSVVAYANEIKTGILNVNPELIKSNGAVSEKVVIEMAYNIRKIMNTDYSIATSGIAGPDGGTPEKPVGTVWIAISSKKQTIAKKYLYNLSRELNIKRASIAALNDLRKVFIAENMIFKDH
jgi:nicotinamide-nucleotide amidase